MIFPALPSVSPSAALPVPQDVAWDFAAGIPIFRAGMPVMVSGQEALKVWVYKALRTARRRYPIYSRAYGCGAWQLVGKPYTEQLKRSEAQRLVRECLLRSPYIRAVENIEVTFSDGTLDISCDVKTIYGEVTVHV